jgi:hypothetical protein
MLFHSCLLFYCRTVCLCCFGLLRQARQRGDATRTLKQSAQLRVPESGVPGQLTVVRQAIYQACLRRSLAVADT